MSSNIKYLLFLLGLLGAVAIFMLMSGHLFLSEHVGDTLHVLEASLRMADGELPHLDFMTPIGILALAPMAAFLKLGFGPGQSLILANICFALLILPATYWVGVQKFTGATRLFFGAVIMIFSLAFIYGGLDFETSFAMHYNRWAWAISFLLLAVVLLPNVQNDRNDLSDAVIIGGGLSVLVLMKMTYFLAFGGASLLILLLSRRFRLVLYIAAIGLVVLVFTTLLLGVDFWLAYAGNLIELTTGTIRQYPAAPLLSTLTDPDRVIGVAILLVTIVVFRNSQFKDLGTGLLILFPAFIYVSYQNYGNDPKWLFVVVYCLLALAPKIAGEKILKVDLRMVGTGAIVAALTIFVPVLLTMSSSIVSAASSGNDTSVALPFHQLENDIWLTSGPVTAKLVYDLPDDVESFDGDDNLNLDDQVVDGKLLPKCEWLGDYIGYIEAHRDFLENYPEVTNQPLLAAVHVNINWMFHPVARLKDGAPWYYGDLSGFDDAKYYLVPTCPLSLDIRGESLKSMQATGWGLRMVGEDDDFRLFEIIR